MATKKKAKKDFPKKSGLRKSPEKVKEEGVSQSDFNNLKRRLELLEVRVDEIDRLYDAPDPEPEEHEQESAQGTTDEP
jgi:hypothetical protein